MALFKKVYEKLLMNNVVIIIKCAKEYKICLTINYVPESINHVPFQQKMNSEKPSGLDPLFY